MASANNKYVVYLTMLHRSLINIFKKDPVHILVEHQKYMRTVKKKRLKLIRRIPADYANEV